ncbi:hypothetical protein ACMFMG_008038 [Clarireedia jacksonii]
MSASDARTKGVAFPQDVVSLLVCVPSPSKPPGRKHRERKDSEDCDATQRGSDDRPSSPVAGICVIHRPEKGYLATNTEQIGPAVKDRWRTVGPLIEMQQIAFQS